MRELDTDSRYDISDELGKHFFTNIDIYKQLAFSYVRNMTVAEDIVSDCFVQMWSHRDSLDPEKGDFRRYILHSIKNACLQYIRLNTIHTRIHDELADKAFWEYKISLCSLEKTETESLLFSDEIQKTVREAMAGMPDLTRKIFYDSRVLELPQKEIAQKHGLSVRQVKWEITKALNILKKALKDYIPIFFFIQYLN